MTPPPPRGPEQRPPPVRRPRPRRSPRTLRDGPATVRRWRRGGPAAGPKFARLFISPLPQSRPRALTFIFLLDPLQVAGGLQQHLHVVQEGIHPRPRVKNVPQGTPGPAGLPRRSPRFSPRPPAFPHAPPQPSGPACAAERAAVPVCGGARARRRRGPSAAAAAASCRLCAVFVPRAAAAVPPPHTPPLPAPRSPSGRPGPSAPAECERRPPRCSESGCRARSGAGEQEGPPRVPAVRPAPAEPAVPRVAPRHPWHSASPLVIPRSPLSPLVNPCRPIATSRHPVSLPTPSSRDRYPSHSGTRGLSQPRAKLSVPPHPQGTPVDPLEMQQQCCDITSL